LTVERLLANVANKFQEVNMPQFSTKLNSKVIRGDAFEFSLTFKDDSLNLRLPIQAVDVVNRTFKVSGDYTSAFTASRAFRLVGSDCQQANKTYTVSSSSYSSGTDLTTVTIPAPSTNSVTAVSSTANTFTVTGDLRLIYPNGQAFYCSGDTTSSVNKQYIVRQTEYNGTSTVIYCVNDIPQGVTGDGSLFVPVIPPLVNETGSLLFQNAVAVDVTNYTISASIRPSVGSDTLIETFTVTKSDTVTGKVTFSLTGAETAAVNKGVYAFDILVEPPTGLEYRLPDDGPSRISFVDAVT
jgi:hypothetical protein